MEMASYPGGSVLRTKETEMMQGLKMSINSISNEMDIGGQSNQAYEEDSCDSIDSVSDDTDTESSAADGYSIEETKEVQYRQTEPTFKSPNQERSEAKSWDVFRVTSEDNVSRSSIECWNACFLISRIMFSSLLFMLVFATSIISKMTFLFMTANIFPSTTEKNLKTLNGTLSYTLNSTDVRWIWGILITVTAPYLFTILKYLWVLMLQRTWPMQWNTLIVALILESLHSIGLCIFVLVVLPSFDPLTAGAVSFCICPIPGILKIVFPLREHDDKSKLPTRIHVARVLNILAFAGQIASICLWGYYIYCSKTSNSLILIPLVILSPILISISWWENFIPQSSTERLKTSLRYTKTESKIPWIFRFKKNMRREKVRIGIITNLWKIILTLLVMPALLFGASCKDGDACIKTIFFESTEKAELNIVYTNLTFETPQKDSCYSYLPFVVAIINVMSSVICYKCVKSASKILAQKLSYAVPVVLSTPVVIGLFWGIYSGFITLKIGTDAQTCAIPLPVWASKNYDPSSMFKNIQFSWSAILAGLFGFLSFLMISNHIWSPDKERLIATDRLFVRTLYDGVFPDQSLFLNRRRIVKETKTEKHKEIKELPIPNDTDENSQNKEWSELREDDTPMIYMCATMWHESEVEMVQILKSIFRQDYDQCARRNLQLGLGVKDPDYYEFEAHIFFDDAFESRQDSNGIYKVNSYVKQLIASVETAARSVPGISKTIDPPIRTNTPYGGRLEWRLPGENKLIAHLKDKTKIRHRKRWSQVMYMYYFLAHKLAKLPGKSRRQKRTIAENTFLLALDGDVDFQPNAVQLLVDRMRKNPNVGAACGRIHPIGSGPMVWYQQFEYAVSHWLQKAAENIMGCVLCSPGCFSLFRGSALMDDNVMAKYTKVPTEPHHYVQYDQGEDRWLCTLMLQQGYKVEYVAASDALTYAPESFYEFYNQRRRWSPSTMANIIDLLMDWRNVTRKNEDITKIYILYQMFLMICSILTPGTIFLMVLGAISMAFPAIPPFAGMIVNLIPVIGMIILCFVAKSSTQLAYAAVVSTCYSLLMMIVLVGILLEAVTAGLCSVTTLFLLFVVGVFFVSAVIHPQEFYCVLHGFLYFLSIPSMSMLLMIYSLGNLHVVSWGTRETKETPPQQTNQATTTKSARSSTLLDSFGLGEEKSEYLLSCGKFIRCCPVKRTDDRPFRIILERLDGIEAQIMKDTEEFNPEEQKEEENVHFSSLSDMIDGHIERSNPLFNDEEHKHEQMNSQSWMDDSDLKKGSVAVLDNDEKLFWEEFIPKYLKPLDTDKEHEKQMHQGLIELRNKVCLAFLLMNALFVTIVYVLTEVNANTKHALSVKLPCTVSEGPPGRGYIEPISFAFTAIFGIMLFLQFICMLMHRMSTFVHIVASNKLDWKKKLIAGITAKTEVPTDIGVEDGLEIVKGLQAVKEDDTISIASVDTTYSEDSYKRTENKSRDMWKRYTKRLREQTQQQPQPQDLRVQFAKNLSKFTKALEEGDDASTRGMQEENNAILYEQKISEVKRLLKDRFNRKTLAAVRTIAENQRRTSEIKRRATALNRKRIVQSRWRAIEEKIRLTQEMHKGVTSYPDRPTKVAFAAVTKAALAQEKRRRLEEGEEVQETGISETTFKKPYKNLDHDEKDNNEPSEDNTQRQPDLENQREILLDIEEKGTDEEDSFSNPQTKQEESKDEKDASVEVTNF